MSSIVMIIYNLADTYFIGMLDNPVQNAAVTLSAPVLLAFNAVNNLFGVGGSSMMSRALGRKDYRTVRESSAFSFYGALICSVSFSLLFLFFGENILYVLGADSETVDATLTYIKWTVVFGAVPAILQTTMAYIIRSEGYSAMASIGTISGCLLNIILDPLFALPFGLGLEVEGVALATFISNCVSCVYFLVLIIFVLRKKTSISINPKDFHFRKPIVTGIFTVGISACIQNLLNVTGMTILTNFVSAFGTTAIAAMGIVQKITQVPLYVFLGVSQGVAPLIAYNYASKNYRRMKHTVTFTGTLITSLSVFAVLILFFSGEGIITLFMKNTEVVSCGSGLIKGFCMALPFLCLDFLAVGVFQSLGNGKNAMIFAVTRKIILEIPALLILNKLFPLYGLAWAQFCAELVLSIIAVIILRNIFRKHEKEIT
ncbi:MAG: MATE family efflux transporter [Clostridia bacterium]|nr:MATE family efflux transporter [Clostridia bacterium]